MIDVIDKPVIEIYESIKRVTTVDVEVVNRVIPELLTDPKAIYSFILTALGVPKDITIANPNVIKILAINQKLREFLIQEAYNKIKEFFPDSQLILDYYRDPESDGETMMLYIQVSMNPEEAFEVLKRFDEEWWLEKALEYKDLCIHLRLV